MSASMTVLAGLLAPMQPHESPARTWATVRIGSKVYKECHGRILVSADQR